MRSLATFLALLMCCAGSVAAGAGPQAFKGHRLDDALRMLQQRGLPIVFSSEIVTPGMWVVDEPRSTTPRQQLDELLAPHGLRAERGPGAVIQVVRSRSALTPASTKKPRQSASHSGVATGALDRSPEVSTYTERVTVTGSRVAYLDRGVSQVEIDGTDLRAASSILQDDGLGAMQAMPQVASVDDFRSEFSVRGSPYHHVGVVIDGVATPWLQHTVYGRRDAGSLSMFGAAIVDRATLQAGAYPRRYDDTLGAQLELTLREGSRRAKHFSGAAGGTSAAFVGEGPFADGRGSWIVSARNSYRPWPAKRLGLNDVGFAFSDAHAKLVFDVTPTQQISATALGGRSTLDAPDEPLPTALAAGINRAALFSVNWRSAPSSHTVFRQRLSFVGQQLFNTRSTGQVGASSSNHAFAYRGEALRSLFGGVLEAGGEIRRLSGTRYLSADDAGGAGGPAGARWLNRSAYAHFVRGIARGLSLAAGLRASESTLVRDHAVTPWILGAWSFRPGWTVNASAGASRQFPELDALQGGPGAADLKAERATHVDIGIARRLASGFRWEATVFSRAENAVLREPDLRPRLSQEILIYPPASGRYQNVLQGTARGIELLVARDSAAPLSGWISYSYATTLQTDISTHERFRGDLDRPHALNAAGVFRISDATSVGIVFRGASGVPIPGYFSSSAGRLFAGERRNEVRLPPYARLDVRAQRSFASLRHRATLFAEMLNVLNRQNQGPADGFVQPLTGRADGFSRLLIQRRASIGIEIDLTP